MTRRRARWRVQYEANAADHAFFISHVREDREAVEELLRAIQRLSQDLTGTPFRCFLDTADWPDGRPNLEVIRDCLLRSRQMIAWITPDFLKAERGWAWIELAYAQLLELALNETIPREETLQYIVPLFRGVTVHDVEATPWLDFWSKRFQQFRDHEPTIDELAKCLVEFSMDEDQRRRTYL